MPTGHLIGATQVLDGSGTAIATLQQGTYESPQIDLVFAHAGAIGAIQRGANYTLRDAGGTTYRCVATGPDGTTMYHFVVAG